MAGYSKKSLVQKLGIRDGFSSVVLNPPTGYVKGLTITSSPLFNHHDFIQFFTSSKSELEKEFPKLQKAIKPAGMVWISWPKGSSKVPTDLNENGVRDIGLKNGMVDVKVAAIDEIWSGLKFVIRLKDR